MRFALANWGTRGEIEPFVAIGRELVNRGHDVQMAVAPEMVDFAEAAGPQAIPYGPALKEVLDPHRDFWADLFTRPWNVKKLGKSMNEYTGPLNDHRPAVSEILKSLTEGADLLLTGMNYEDLAINVAEYCNVPLATLQIFPLRANGRLLPNLPPRAAFAAMTASEWLAWRGAKKFEDAQRDKLGLPRATSPWPQRITDAKALELQAFDEACYPGLAADWASWNGRRPFVGSLSMELPTANDDAVASWIAAGKPPICFGFGSVGVESAAETLAMITGACEQLGERALVCAAGSDFDTIRDSENLKVVNVMNYAAALPSCRAFVHHGGCGTTNAGLRAGLPTVILWTLPDQGLWGARVKRLKVGTGRRFSATTQKSLLADLRTVLAPDYQRRAGELATRMTKSTESITTTVDMVESFALNKRVI